MRPVMASSHEAGCPRRARVPLDEARSRARASGRGVRPLMQFVASASRARGRARAGRLRRRRRQTTAHRPGLFGYDAGAKPGYQDHGVVSQAAGIKVHDISFASPRGGRVQGYLHGPARRRQVPGRHLPARIRRLAAQLRARVELARRAPRRRHDDRLAVRPSGAGSSRASRACDTSGPEYPGGRRRAPRDRRAPVAEAGGRRPDRHPRVQRGREDGGHRRRGRPAREGGRDRLGGRAEAGEFVNASPPAVFAHRCAPSSARPTRRATSARPRASCSSRSAATTNGRAAERSEPDGKAAGDAEVKRYDWGTSSSRSRPRSTTSSTC